MVQGLDRSTGGGASATPYPRRFGPYVLVDALGFGGMGHVSLAISGVPGLETVCVVKRVIAHLRDRPDYAQRFLDEANIARRLVHGNLVQTHAVGEVGGELFIAQEFVEGHDLADVLHRCATRDDVVFPTDLAVYVASEVARGLAFAHDFEGLNLVHRDISPTNICLSYGGEVKIIDFGTARSAIKTAQTHPRAGQSGKLPYMAPDQLLGGAVDRRTDLYSLGVVLWEMLARRPMGTKVSAGAIEVPNETPAEMMFRIANLDPPPPSTVNPRVPSEVDAIVVRTLARRPADRFQRASDLRGELLRALPPGFDGATALADLMGRLFDAERERALRVEMMAEARPLLGKSHEQSSPAPASGLAGPASAGRVSTAPVTFETKRKRRAGPLVGAGVAAAILIGVGFHALREPAPPSRTSPVSRDPEAVPAPHAAQPPVQSTAPTGESPPVVEPGTHAAPPPAEHHQVSSRPKPSPNRQPAAPPVAAPAPDPKGLLQRAGRAFQAAAFADALELGQQAVAAGGGASAYLLIGNTLVRMQRIDEAERAYLNALKLDPSDKVIQDRLDMIREMRSAHRSP